MKVWTAALPLDGDLLFAVTERHSGVSDAPFDSLNLSYAVGDAPRAVMTNRRRAARALGFDPARVIAAQQVHGDGVAVVTRADRGRGAWDTESAVPATDALITTKKRLPLTLSVADCAPVLVFDPCHRVIALVHVGWRGAVGGILLRVIETMVTRFDCAPSELRAMAGPHLGPCCLEVDEPVADQFRSRLRSAVIDRPGEKPHLDLAAAIAEDLAHAGVRPEHLSLTALCTKCNAYDYFSHRASGGRTGRMWAVAMLR